MQRQRALRAGGCDKATSEGALGWTSRERASMGVVMPQHAPGAPAERDSTVHLMMLIDCLNQFYFGLHEF